MKPAPSVTLAVTIARPPSEVYAYLHDPTHLPEWAGGFFKSARREGEGWRCETSLGAVHLRMVDDNPHGLLDHRVTLPDGQEFDNPMRVLRNGDGAELIFTLFRPEGMDDAQFAEDQATVKKDLETAARILESRGR
jgi:uncharacterized protein YndB with AHSA1/START domain